MSSTGSLTLSYLHDARRPSAPVKPKGFKNHLVQNPPSPSPSSEEPEVISDGDSSPEGDSGDELEYPGSDGSLSLVRHCLL